MLSKQQKIQKDLLELKEQVSQRYNYILRYLNRHPL